MFTDTRGRGRGSIRNVHSNCCSFADPTSMFIATIGWGEHIAKAPVRTRRGCRPDHCDLFVLLQDNGRVRANLAEHPSYLRIHAPEWAAHSNRPGAGVAGLSSPAGNAPHRCQPDVFCRGGGEDPLGAELPHSLRAHHPGRPGAFGYLCTRGVSVRDRIGALGGGVRFLLAETDTEPGSCGASRHPGCAREEASGAFPLAPSSCPSK
jgi:hypothetical protein